MSVLFAGGENSEVDIIGGSTIVDGSGASYRTAYARCGIRVGGAGVLHTFTGELAAYIAAQGTACDIWYGFQYRGSGGAFTSNLCVEFCGVDPAGVLGLYVPFLRLWNADFTATGTCTFQLWNGAAWNDYPASLVGQPTASPAEWTFRLKRHATEGKFQWWINGALWWEFVGNTTLYFSNVTRVIWGIAGSNGTATVSEIIATSGDDPRVGMNCFSAYYTADGADTGWTGSYADVAENSENTATLLTAATSGLDHGFVHFPLPALSAGTIIRAVVVSGKWRTAAGAPPNLSGFLRIGGTKYANAPLPAAVQAVQGVASLLQYIWHVSPASGLSFSVTEFNNTEPGNRSMP